MAGYQRMIRYIPDDRVIDIGREISPADFAILESLHGQIKRGDNVLECLSPGGDRWLTVYRHDSGVYYARHFPGGAHEGSHRIIRKSDEHLRAQDYTERAFTDAGYTAAQEVTTNNRTRIDVVALDSPRTCGFEIQLSPATETSIKNRTTRSLHATAIRGQHARLLAEGGILPVWFCPVPTRPSWLYSVPSVETQDVSWTGLPPAGSVTAIGVRRIVAEKCTPGSRWEKCPRLGSGWCRGTHPYAELVTG